MARDNRRRQRPWWASVALYAAVAFLCATMLLPFLWMLRASLCGDREVVEAIRTLSDVLPSSFHPENYPRVFSTIPFWRYLLNTLIVTTCAVVGTVISSSLCAYAFAFCRARGAKTIFLLVLGTMMIPGAVTLIPVFVLFRQLGWIDTLKPLIVPAFFGSAFNIFLFRQFFKGLPKALFEAARLDGANGLQIYWRVVMPLARPVTITVAIFTFMGTWNDFMGPLIFLNSQENWTLQLGLNSFIGQVGNQMNLLMACAVMVLLPVLVVFFALQRHFVRGISATGLKQ